MTASLGCELNLGKNLRGISPKSYGVDMATGEIVKPHQPVGVIAAQSVGEPGTQLTLWCASF